MSAKDGPPALSLVPTQNEHGATGMGFTQREADDREKQTGRPEFVLPLLLRYLRPANCVS